MRTRTLFIVIVIVMLLLTLYPVIYSSIYSKNLSKNPFSCPPLIPCASSPPPQSTCYTLCIVDMENSSFSPATLNVVRGAVVKWVNLDSVPHTSTSLASNGWNSPFIEPGGYFELNTSSLQPGTYYYRCTIHAQMVGQLNILPSNSTG
ncbi:MAG: cupredoxin domain-containing protein [Conexivisphaerales archaeon]